MATLGLGRSWWLSTLPTGQRVTKQQTANLRTSTVQHPPGYYSSERKFCLLTSTSCTNTHTQSLGHAPVNFISSPACQELSRIAWLRTGFWQDTASTSQVPRCVWKALSSILHVYSNQNTWLFPIECSNFFFVTK